MPFRDSLDKVVTTYLGAVAAKPFMYEDQLIRPKALVVSPLLLRGYTCPSGCGGCCPRFTLDYLPHETRPYDMGSRPVAINGRILPIYSDQQNDHRDYHCRNLDKKTGRCGIYPTRPFSCDFELIRFMVSADRALMLQRLFSRGWAMLRVDGDRGARCEMLPATQQSTAAVVRKLTRLQSWADYFGIETRIANIIRWIDGGARAPLVLPEP